LSKAPGIVISGTITNSIADAKGAMETWFLIVGIWDILRSEMRTWYPACKRDLRTAKPTNPVLPVIWDSVLESNESNEMRGGRKRGRELQILSLLPFRIVFWREDEECFEWMFEGNFYPLLRRIF
jgi:hypothetical protein